MTNTALSGNARFTKRSLLFQTRVMWSSFRDEGWYRYVVLCVRRFENSHVALTDHDLDHLDHLQIIYRS